MRPRRPSSPRSERSKREEGYVGEAGRLDGHVDAASVGRRDDGDPTAILPIEMAQCGLLVTPHHPRDGRCGAQSTGHVAIAQLPRSCRHRPEPLDEPVRALREAGQIERFGRRPIGRTAQQIALAGADPERSDDVELLRRLDALGDDEGAPAVGEVAQRLEDLERGLADGPALDEREVDLDDVEPELAQQPQPGVAGTDVVGGDAGSRRPGRPRPPGAAGRGPRRPRARSARARCSAGPGHGGRSAAAGRGR